MPQPDDDYEPVFKKSKWGTSRYTYNPANPVGMALIILSLVFAGVMMFLMEERKGPFEPPEQTPWSPSIEENPTFSWERSTPPTTSPAPSPSSTR
ncbi:hypothetical protein [Streptomyces cucumeris]|uniref:hypothetical protein n=1 Tax=Streptomyces cucumeris TaxID=2962890 RepID=UPI003D75FFD2